MESVFSRGMLTNEWIKGFIEKRNIEKLDRNIVLSFIEKIIIHEGSRLEIVFKYADEYKAACKIALNYSEFSNQEVCIDG